VERLKEANRLGTRNTANLVAEADELRAALETAEKDRDEAAAKSAAWAAQATAAGWVIDEIKLTDYAFAFLKRCRDAEAKAQRADELRAEVQLWKEKFLRAKPPEETQ
jgi:hypothetical protein